MALLIYLIKAFAPFYWVQKSYSIKETIIPKQPENLARSKFKFSDCLGINSISLIAFISGHEDDKV